MFRESGCLTRYYDSNPPDPGNSLKTYLFGGLILVLWKKDSEDIGDMTKIKGLVLLNGVQSRILSECRVLTGET
jgi:hypothetical protein